MKRDMDLVRKLIFALEDSNHGFAPHVEVEGYTEERIGYHYYIMLQAGLIKGSDMTSMGCPSPQAMPTSLTWAGHEFADAARSDTIWEKAKKTIKEKVGSASVGLVTEYLAKLGKEALGM